MRALRHLSHSGDEPGLTTVMLVMPGTGQVGVPLDPHRLEGRRSITLAPRAPCLAGFKEQALLLRCMDSRHWGWHQADEGWDPSLTAGFKTLLYIYH